jgi:exopolysaccharide biosynthesis polyprenyl glycosylphosphotransferase
MGSYAVNIEEGRDAALLTKFSRATGVISRQSQWRIFLISLIISDFLMIAFAFRFAYWIRFEQFVHIFVEDAIISVTHYRLLTLLLFPIWLGLIAMDGLYQRKNLLGGIQEYSKVFFASSLGLVIVIIVGFLNPGLYIARGWLLLAWMLSFIFVAAGRFFLRRIVYQLRKYGYFITPAIIVGGNQEGRWLAEQLVSWKTSGLLLLGFVDEIVPPGTPLFRNLCSLGTVDHLDDIIQKYDVGELILATSAISSRNKQLEIFKKYGISSDICVRMSSGLYEIITTGLTVNEFAYVPLVTINKARLTGLNEGLKLLLDYCVTIPGLILLSPILLLITLAIKLDSPGPIIHRRRVMGMNGKTFDAYKFRSMYINGDQILEAHPELKAEMALNHKIKNDPRITRVGRLLRKYSLDELPQLFNVMRREMSLVGPRMISPEEVVKYSQWDINLFTVRPGLSGLWQVSGRSDVSYEERVQMDMYYIRNWTIWLDIQILFQTIPAVIQGRGAY